MSILEPLPVGAVYAVVTTGIYCRAGCPGRPKPENVRILSSRQVARDQGFRACLRCKPDDVST
ncbi:MAG: Ada metal-binding domain-containing protein [Pseudomonadota bacterium]